MHPSPRLAALVLFALSGCHASPDSLAVSENVTAQDAARREGDREAHPRGAMIRW